MTRWLALLLLVFAVPVRAETEVDIELVLAVDVSGSIDHDEARLQREGYIAALTDPKVVQAIKGGLHGKVALAYFEWADISYRTLVVDWTLVSDERSARSFAARLADAPIATGMRTSISGAIDFALPLFDGNGYAGVRRVIDISGDGPNNNGIMVNVARDLALARGVTINGLPILNDRPNRFGFPTMPDLDRYYEGCVIGGPGAFVVAAKSFADFGNAIRSKLLLEIAGRVPPARPRILPAAAATYDKGCDIGERQSLEYFRRRFSD